MDVDAAQIAASAMPYVTAAVAAYGVSTLDKVRSAAVDGASDATVRIGHQILNRLLARRQSQEVIEGAVIDVTAGEEDSDAALRLQIRKAMTADPDLAQAIAAMLPERDAFRQYAIQRQSNTGSGNIINGDNYGSINPTLGAKS
ncbi:hypothetical protein [Micromonospora sp. WMMD714]|uniref:hypothetical protein n=1 Tax=Micromonospora sp. WMMD714 TaxID=3016097 RepID=UPI00249A93DD|nr:hypothetical protein [Micromonospora sp. WMMD714]WFE61947.1 hypothetical protein O7625_00940 [Micromonospora sp. WMMD714]